MTPQVDAGHELAAPVRPGSGEMFDAIAGRYDRLNRLLSLGLDRRWRRRLVAALGPLRADDCVLDVATGTGDVALAIAAAHPTVRVVGVDPSAQMLAHGDAKIAARGVAARVRLQRGDAERLPFADASFAASTIAFGIRNVTDRAAGLAELVRVTRPGGVVAILELGEPDGALLGRLARWHVRVVVPRLGALLSSAPSYRYLQQSIARFPPPGGFVAMCRAAGLTDVEVVALGFGACHLYVGRAPRQPVAM